MLGGFRESAASPFNPASMVGNQPLETCWYATYVCTSHERKIAVQLQDRQMDCFVPVYRKRPPMEGPPPQMTSAASSTIAASFFPVPPALPHASAWRALSPCKPPLVVRPPPSASRPEKHIGNFFHCGEMQTPTSPF